MLEIIVRFSFQFRVEFFATRVCSATVGYVFRGVCVCPQGGGLIPLILFRSYLVRACLGCAPDPLVRTVAGGGEYRVVLCSGGTPTTTTPLSGIQEDCIQGVPLLLGYGRTHYATGGMPLAVTREDFPVQLSFPLIETK